MILILGIAIGAGSYRLLRDKEAPIPSSYIDPDVGIVNNTDNADNPEYIIRNWSLLSVAYKATAYLRAGDYKSLSMIVHPEFGLVLSPYPTLNLSTNKVFSADQISGFETDATDYVWGVTDNSGEPIELTPSEYFARYVYEQDYANAKTIGLNEIVRTGNSLENIREVFPEADFVDFYVPGETIDGTDSGWSILRLVFEEYDGSLMLAAIIHSEYTV
jgi:hypothetical protein